MKSVVRDSSPAKKKKRRVQNDIFMLSLKQSELLDQTFLSGQGAKDETLNPSIDIISKA